MQLAPMWSRSVLPEDDVDLEEIAPIVDPWAAGDGDRHAGALVIRAQHARIVSDETIFHRIDAIRVSGQHQLANLPQRLLSALDGDGVFEFVKVWDVFHRINFGTVSDPFE